MENNNKIANKLKIFLIAGEPSGDILAGKLIAAIKKQANNDPFYQGKKIELIGIGGIKMQEQGLNSIFPISELSLMGFAEIIPHIPRLLKKIRETANRIIVEQPDMIITIDAPDFCFRVIKKVNKSEKGQKIKKTHLIAPTVWAYRPGRAKKIAKLFDLLLTILPFEPPYFEKYGLKTIFIGHPITEREPDSTKAKIDFRTKYNIEKKQMLLCLTPGSRVGEVKNILPEMIKAVNILAKKHQNLVVAIPAVKKTYNLIQNNLDQFKVKAILTGEEEKTDIFQAADIAIAKSGTNSLELAMEQLPMIVVYKANPITYLLIKIMSKVKFANLINLICNYEVIPEMLQFECQAVKIADKLEKLIKNPEMQKQQIIQSKTALKILGVGSKEKPSEKAAKAVLSLMSYTKFHL